MCDVMRLDEKITMGCLNFGLAAIFGGVMSQKPNHDLWVIDLIYEVIG